MQMPSLGWDCSMCPHTDINRFYYLQFIPHFGVTKKGFHFILSLKLDYTDKCTILQHITVNEVTEDPIRRPENHTHKKRHF